MTVSTSVSLPFVFAIVALLTRERFEEKRWSGRLPRLGQGRLPLLGFGIGVEFGFRVGVYHSLENDPLVESAAIRTFLPTPLVEFVARALVERQNRVDHFENVG